MKLMDSLRARHGEARAHAAADDAWNGSRRLADDALEALHGGLDSAESRMRAVREDLREQLWRAGSRSAGYVRDEPVKSLLMAAAAGALVALAVRALTRR